MPTWSSFPLAPPGTTVLGISADDWNARIEHSFKNELVDKTPNLKVKRHTATATLPKRQTKLSAGYDLCADEEYTLEAGARRAIATNISVEIPEGHYGRVAPRSGLAVNDGLNTMAGVIDADYRGLVGVVLVNHSHNSFQVKVGMRVAQLLLEKISTPDVEEITEHTITERGEGGFGSTGVGSV